MKKIQNRHTCSESWNYSNFFFVKPRFALAWNSWTNLRQRVALIELSYWILSTLFLLRWSGYGGGFTLLWRLRLPSFMGVCTNSVNFIQKRIFFKKSIRCRNGFPLKNNKIIFVNIYITPIQKWQCSESKIDGNVAWWVSIDGFRFSISHIESKWLLEAVLHFEWQKWTP